MENLQCKPPRERLELTGKLPGELPGELPGKLLGKVLGELLGELPVELPGDLPGELPESFLESFLENFQESFLDSFLDWIPHFGVVTRQMQFSGIWLLLACHHHAAGHLIALWILIVLPVVLEVGKVSSPRIILFC